MTSEKPFYIDSIFYTGAVTGSFCFGHLYERP